MAVKVWFGAVEATEVEVTSPTTLTCITPPANAPGKVAVEVDVDGRRVTKQGAFEYTPAAPKPGTPVITSPKGGTLPASPDSYAGTCPTPHCAIAIFAAVVNPTTGVTTTFSMKARIQDSGATTNWIIPKSAITDGLLPGTWELYAVAIAEKGAGLESDPSPHITVHLSDPHQHGRDVQEVP